MYCRVKPVLTGPGIPPSILELQPHSRTPHCVACSSCIACHAGSSPCSQDQEAPTVYWSCSHTSGHLIAWHVHGACMHCRIKPMLTGPGSAPSVLELQPHSKTLRIGPARGGRQFTFDHIFPPGEFAMWAQSMPACSFGSTRPCALDVHLSVWARDTVAQVLFGVVSAAGMHMLVFKNPSRLH